MKAAEAILGGALAAALITTLALTLLNLATGATAEPHFLLSMLMWFVSTALLAIGGAATLGLAWHAFASTREWRGVHAYWLPAALVGGVPIMLFTLSIPLVALALCVYGAILGGLTGLFAWLIRRPDRDALPNPPTSPS